MSNDSFFSGHIINPILGLFLYVVLLGPVAAFELKGKNIQALCSNNNSKEIVHTWM